MEKISDALKKKKDDEAAQRWTGVSPTAKMCKTCKFAQPDTKYVKGYRKTNCAVFTDEDKPMEILWNDADCDFYVEAKDE